MQTAKEVLRIFASNYAGSGKSVAFVDDILSIMGNNDPELSKPQIELLNCTLEWILDEAKKNLGNISDHFTPKKGFFIAVIPIQISTVIAFIQSCK